jgi:hypothetical protein
LCRRTTGCSPGGASIARTSNRDGAFPARYSRRNCRAIRKRCHCFSRVTASSGEPNSPPAAVRVFTSTNATVPPSYPTRSISPFIPRQVKFRAIITYPCRRRYQYAYVSPRTPVRRALSFTSSREAGADESDRPFRAAQSTTPNIARAKIRTVSSFLPSWFSR